MPFTKVKVTGTFHDPSGRLLNGRVEATLSGVMQDSNNTAAPKVIKAQIINGLLAMELYATDDEGTRPEHNFYTFKISYAGGPLEEFKAPLPHANASINIAELRELGGQVGIPIQNRPELSVYSSNQAIVEALGFLQLAVVQGIRGSGEPAMPRLTGPEGPEGPPGPPGTGLLGESYNAGEESILNVFPSGYQPAPVPDIVTFTLSKPSLVELLFSIELLAVEGSTIETSIFIDNTSVIGSFTYPTEIWSRASLEGNGQFSIIGSPSPYGGSPCAVVLGAGTHTYELRYSTNPKVGAKIRDRLLVAKL